MPAADVVSSGAGILVVNTLAAAGMPATAAAPPAEKNDVEHAASQSRTMPQSPTKSFFMVRHGS